jgi:flagellar basal body-associated protein FliL
LLLSEQDGNKLRTAAGKEELRQKALQLAKKVLKEQTGKDSVEELYFTAFFVQ